MISKELEAEVLRLHHAEKWPVGTIASQLHLHHSTVTRVLTQAGLKPKAMLRSPSIMDPYVPLILEMLTKYPRLRASRLCQMESRSSPPLHFLRASGDSATSGPNDLSGWCQISPGGLRVA